MITIRLPWPDKRLSPNAPMCWTSDDDEYLKRHHGTKTIKEIADCMGRTKASIRARITRLGISKKENWTFEQLEMLRAAYAEAGPKGYVALTELSKSIGKEKSNVCRKARLLGLGTSPNRIRVKERKDRRKFNTKEELSEYRSMLAKLRLAAEGHPRGFKGHKHSVEAKKIISQKSKAFNLFMSEEKRAEISMKISRTRMEKGVSPPNVKRGSWAAGWREIGGKRNYYRSMWEANYARYLEWLKSRGEIKDWAHEPEVFWFENVKRGVRSYKPDFRVWELNGTSALHEVKGWMDARSKTCLSRMKKYYPSEKVILIDASQYRAIRMKVMGIVPEWEDSARDRRGA